MATTQRSVDSDGVKGLFHWVNTFGAIVDTATALWTFFSGGCQLELWHLLFFLPLLTEVTLDPARTAHKAAVA